MHSVIDLNLICAENFTIAESLNLVNFNDEEFNEDVYAMFPSLISQIPPQPPSKNTCDLVSCVGDGLAAVNDVRASCAQTGSGAANSYANRASS